MNTVERNGVHSPAVLTPGEAAKKAAALRSAVLGAISVEDVRQVVQSLMKRAVLGDQNATRTVLQIIGTGSTLIDADDDDGEGPRQVAAVPAEPPPGKALGPGAATPAGPPHRNGATATPGGSTR